MNSLLGRAMRILAVWAVLLSIENAVAVMSRSASGYALHDWLTGQFLGVPFALALLVPCAVTLVVLARQISGRRAHVVAAVTAVALMAVAFALTVGPTFAAFERRAGFILGAGLAGFVLAFTFVRRVPLDRPRVLAILGGGIAVVAWHADQRILPGLYFALHVSFVAVALAASSALALLIPDRSRGSARRLVLVIAGGVALVWSMVSVIMLNRDEHVRHVLLRDAPVLGRLVFLSSRLPFGTSKSWQNDLATGAPSPEIVRIVHAPELPRTLDWSGCDVLLVTVDALRPDHLGVYGYDRPTSPAFDKLAARGARFEYAYSAAPQTAYSIASLMAGQNMHPLLAAGRASTTMLWPEYMRELGYVTTAFYPPIVFTIDVHRFEELRAKGLGFEHRSTSACCTHELHEQLSAYVSSAPADKPLFVWVHVLEPHDPYEMHDSHPFPGGREMDMYDSEVAVSDAFIGQAVTLMESRPNCEVIIVTADHGEAFDEHGVSYHGTSVYEEQVRVPLVIVGPGVAPAVISRTVQTIDLLPTTMSALGGPRPEGLIGRDLSDLLTGRDVNDDPGLAFAETARYSMVALGTERLICDRDAATCALYDLATDPRQQTEIRDRPDRVRFFRQLTDALGVTVKTKLSFPLRIPAVSPRVVPGATLQRGHVVVEADKLVATGEAGTLVFGPYLVLPTGAYELRWMGRGIDSPGQIAFSVRTQREVLAHATVDAISIPAHSGELMRLTFALDRPRLDIELVVESAGGGRIMLEQVVLDRTDDDPRADPTTYPVQMAAIGPQVKRANVELQSNTLVATGVDGTLVYGPYIDLARGSYELTWFGKGIDSPGEIVFRVTADSGRNVLASVVRDANDLRKDRGELIRVPFALDRAHSKLEFVVESGNGGRVALEQLLIDKKWLSRAMR